MRCSIRPRRSVWARRSWRASSRPTRCSSGSGRASPKRWARTFRRTGLERERRLDPAERERLLEAVQRHPQSDTRRKLAGPARLRAIELLDRRQPVHPVGVHAAQQSAVLEDRVDADDAAVETYLLLVSVDAKQAGDAVSAKQGERVEHHL